MTTRRQALQQIRAGGSLWRILAVQAVQQCRPEIDQDLAAVDSLGVSDPVRRAQLRRSVLVASRRYRRAQGVPSAQLLGPKMLTLQITLIASAVLGLLHCGRMDLADTIRFAGAAVAGVAGVAALLWVLSVKLNTYVRRRGQAAAMLLFLTALPVASAWWTVVHSHTERDVTASGAIFGWDSGMAAMTLFMAWITVETRMQNRRADAECGHYDGLALEAVRLAGKIAENRAEWRSASTVRNWCHQLETLAARTEFRVSVHERVPLQSLRLRAELRGEALRVAEVFRAHKMPLLRAYAPEHVDPVVESLACAVEALLAGDVQALLANAPAHVPRSRVVRDAVARALPPAVMIAAAVWLPGLVHLSGTAASSTSALLGATGVVTLVSPQAAGRISDALAKFLPLK